MQTLEAGVSRSVRWEKEAPKEVNGIGDEQWTGPIAIRFNISNVQRPLAAASKVAGQGNRIIMEGSGGYIENIATGERIQLRLERGVYVFDVKFDDGTSGAMAVDSGAGARAPARIEPHAVDLIDEPLHVGEEELVNDGRDATVRARLMVHGGLAL